MLATTTPSPAAPVVLAFMRMRSNCQHLAGRPDDWDVTQCRCKGNNHKGSICAMGYCPILRDQADQQAVGWR